MAGKRGVRRDWKKVTHEYCQNACDPIIKSRDSDDKIANSLMYIQCKRTGHKKLYYQQCCKYYREAK